MKSKFPILLLFLWCLFLIKVLVLKDIPAIRVGIVILDFSGTQEGAANLIPFSTIFSYFSEGRGWLIPGINIVGNIMLLIPFGFLMDMVFPHHDNRKKIIISVASGFIIEILQVLLHIGIFDIDDVILNALGVLAGYYLVLPATRFFARQGVARLTIISTAAFVFLSGLFTAIYFRDKAFPIGFVRDQLYPRKDVRADDPCNATGGTGKIISLDGKTITILKKDGKQEIILFNANTRVRTSSDDASITDLKQGDQVTLIIPESADGSMTASVILICAD